MTCYNIKLAAILPSGLYSHMNEVRRQNETDNELVLRLLSAGAFRSEVMIKYPLSFRLPWKLDESKYLILDADDNYLIEDSDMELLNSIIHLVNNR